MCCDAICDFLPEKVYFNVLVLLLCMQMLYCFSVTLGLCVYMRFMIMLSMMSASSQEQLLCAFCDIGASVYGVSGVLDYVAEGCRQTKTN